MSTTIVMPKAGLTMVEGTIAEWKVAEGAYVKKGDVLMEYENEKNTIDCEALAEGYVHIIAKEGNTELMDAMNKALAAFLASDDCAALKTKYGIE